MTPKPEPMNGAHSLVRTLIDSGIDTCFANPGTSEMHFVAALDRIPGIDCVLGLQENVVTGMADGYYRMTRRPAATLLHCGPGLMNGLANLHNAMRAGSGIVNIVGDHATHHAPFDPPLAQDTDALARTVSSWVQTSQRSADVGRDAATAVQEASRPGGGIATLILPSDASWNPGGQVASRLPVPGPPPLQAQVIDAAARALRDHGSEVLILLGAEAALEAGQALAWRIAAATGATAMVEFPCGRVARGRGRVPLPRVPYNIDMALAALDRFRTVVLVNAVPPVGFFAYPGKPSVLHRDDAVFHALARPEQDALAALTALAEALGAPRTGFPDPGPRPDIVSGPATPEGLARTLAAVLPDNAIVVDESVSFGRDFYAHTHAAAPHDWLHQSGGAIGIGMPLGAGAALGCGRDRRVVTLQADGSGMYTLQALWTQARERLPVTTVILANRRYDILIGEYANVGATPGPTAMEMLDLGNPSLDWVTLARGMGVEAAQAATLERCADLMAQSFRSDTPFLIELLI
ncbi:acetolactate synthase large subunit [Rhodobacter sp. Har01]|uniref:acetolactate synthase large subunit n=1 Tax=Rhodobacter sp. Har01 TaxID=2883999 RepID=UPI001D06953F|nr:acetolactate synthase large subunit [Rhodobacter sp. Har01]MCB6179734.1 acetolactate synthase large subunit [Rhodobacter sp. Har01]